MPDMIRMIRMVSTSLSPRIYVFILLNLTHFGNFLGNFSSKDIPSCLDEIVGSQYIPTAWNKAAATA
jgi:hypothetical protein